MATPFPADHPLLSGAFEPLRMECDCPDLMIEGEIPPELSGTLYRIGPNPQFAPLGTYNPLQGDGMIHGFTIGGGRVAYRNRWVRTRQWSLERQAGRALFSTSDPRAHDASVAGMESQGAANTHIVAHAGRLLALEEGHLPIEINPLTLETLGPFDFGARLPGAMTAHPKVCPETGEMFAFTNFPFQRFDATLALQVIDAAGAVVRPASLVGPYPAFVHDFAITRRHVVFVVCPLTLSLERLRAGGPPLAWEPDRSAFLGLMPRTGAAEDVLWFPAPACMAWHLMNAHEDGGLIHVDLCQQAAPAFPSADGTSAPEADLRQFLTRWTLDPGSAQPVSARRLSDLVCEYPRIDERRTGLSYRYGYVAALGGPGTGDMLHRAIGRYDHASGEMRLWRAPDRQAVSEPVFVARSAAAPEGDGYLLVAVFDEARNASHLAVLDAQRIEAGPVAQAHLDHRVPAGFHGSFVPTA
ncbi:carotenoid oxygenase family protein [Phenylobacterium sp.]|uniref:carotenoid oxygenase family protein n=1 Tax=Phenylobacterium sp. TaxID=1871053 RepID=UPI0030F470EA